MSVATRHAKRAPTGRFVPLVSGEDWDRLVKAAHAHPYGFWGVLGVCPYCDKPHPPGRTDKVFCNERHKTRWHRRTGPLLELLFPRFDGRRWHWYEVRMLGVSA